MCRTMLIRCALDSPALGAYFMYLQLSLSTYRSFSTPLWSWVITLFERVDAVNQKFPNSKFWIFELKNDSKKTFLKNVYKVFGIIQGNVWNVLKVFWALQSHHRSLYCNLMVLKPRNTLWRLFLVKKYIKITYRSK